MTDSFRTNQELYEENSVLKQRIQELEISEADHKWEEEALRASELRYQTIFETTGTTMLIVDEDMTISLANGGFEKLTGYTREEVEGKRKWTEFVEKGDLKMMLTQHQVRRADSGFAKRDYEFRLVHRNGDLRNILLTVDLIPGTKISIASLLDITERKQMEEALRENEKKYRFIAENAVDVISIVDMNLRFTYVSPAVFRSRGFTVEEALNQTLDQVLTPKSMQYAFDVFTEEMALEATGTADHDRIRILELEEYKKDGSLFWVEVTMSYLRDKNGNPIGILQISRDITDRKKAEEELRESEERYRTILENIEDGYYEVDIAGNLTFFNDSVCLMNGYSRAEMMSMNYKQYTDKENSHVLYQAFNKVFRTSEPSKGIDYEIIGKDGAKRYIEASVSLIRNRFGQPIGFRGIMRNITERKRMEAEILALSITDSLTGLPNRRGFLSLAVQQLKLAERNKSGMLLFFADMDGLKWINDKLGHEEGDKAIIEAATVFKETFRTSDIVARLGGDEFAALAVDITEVNSQTFTDRLQNLIDTRNNQENRRYRLSISIGCSYYDPKNPCSIDDLMGSADKLMYEQKQNKKGLLLQGVSLSDS